MTDWMQEFNNDIAQRKQRKQTLSDEERTRQKATYETAGHNIQKHIALLLDPNTMQPVAGKEAQVAQLRGEMGRINEFLTKFSNPNFNAQTGQVSEDPLHKLSDKLHLTKPPAQNVTAGQQMKDLQGIQQKYAEEPPPAPLLTPDEEKQGARIKAGIDPRAGVDKPPHYSDYKEGLRRFVQAEGGDPDEPTAAQEEAFRQQRLKDAAGARAMDTTRTSETTDPFGVKTTTKSTMQRRPAGTPATPGQDKQSKPPGEQKRDLAAIQGKSKIGQPGKVDDKGHIPDSAKVNPGLREAANNLMDGMALKDLQVPQKDRAAVEALARQYGWKGQGMFTPKDMLLVRESTAILGQMSKDPSLTVLDNQISRQKIQQVIQNVDKRSMFGQAIQNYVASQLTEPEQKFVTLYLQAVGRISGLSQLVRSGRATEAQIERLKSELPNPATTTNSAHALQKLQQIQSEIDIALDKGQFIEAPSGVSDDEFLQNVTPH